MNRVLLRMLDIGFSVFGLLIIVPVLPIVALAVILDDVGPVFFFQNRVGHNGNDFRLIKFRTMRRNAEQVGQLTVGERDPRVTRVGYWLRKSKLDELPQLWNVLTGDMSMVGPRPEVRKYVDRYTEAQRRVLSVRPGITDAASIRFANENKILAEQSDPETYYVQVLIPEKIRWNMPYVENPTVGQYLSTIFRTLGAVFSRI